MLPTLEDIYFAQLCLSSELAHGLRQGEVTLTLNLPPYTLAIIGWLADMACDNPATSEDDRDMLAVAARRIGASLVDHADGKVEYVAVTFNLRELALLTLLLNTTIVIWDIPDKELSNSGGFND